MKECGPFCANPKFCFQRGQLMETIDIFMMVYGASELCIAKLNHAFCS